MPGQNMARSISTSVPVRNLARQMPSLLPGKYSRATISSHILLYAPPVRCARKRPNRLATKQLWPRAWLERRCAKKKEHFTSMSSSPVTQFGAPDAPFCDPATARVTIIPAPLEYSVCYMKGTERGPQAILDASSQMELYDEELDCCPIEVGVYTRPALDYTGMDHAAALKVTGDAVREVLERGQLPFTSGGEHSLSALPIAAVRESLPDLTLVHIDADGESRDQYERPPLSPEC